MSDHLLLGRGIVDHRPPVGEQARREHRAEVRKFWLSVLIPVVALSIAASGYYTVGRISEWVEAGEAEKRELIELRMAKAEADSWDCTNGPLERRSPWEWRLCRRERNER